jgi:hypothetical protein
VIHQYQWEMTAGYGFLWQHSSKDIHFHKELALESRRAGAEHRRA